MKNEKVRISVRLSEEEYELFSSCAKQCGLSESQLVSMLIMGKQPQPLPDKNFWLTLEQLYSIHDSLKQLSRFDNSLLKKCDEIEQLILDLQRAITVPKEVDMFGNNKPMAHKRKSA
ncbi:MAG: hypothetical protein NC213_10590 [Acetobacter sp.]|nr:hypothetical protein [Bacteroides sp.]MCM1342183.1 hypothetical protein [Acetobacter sp.]MCM1433611.1 hypothetical protein [Clostridiales bacterium]